jgi:hypothetical protein
MCAAAFMPRSGARIVRTAVTALIGAVVLSMAVSANCCLAGRTAVPSGVLLDALRSNGAQLDMRGSDISDADLQGLSDPAFAEVRSVLLARSGITDAGIRHLRPLDIVELDLYGTQVSDAGLCDLKGLAIERLDLTGTAITDEGLACLSRMPLTRLVLRSTAVSGDGLAYLDGGGISFLDLSFSRATDAGLAAISGWGRLRIIDLSDTPVGDGSLLVLASLPELSQVHISGTGVTPEGIRRFQSERPTVRVFSKHPDR